MSGVHRGEQHALYDARRDTQIPAHKLRLAIIRPGDLDADTKGRLHRPRTAHGRRLELPEGWLAVEIDRRAAEVLCRTYCSEDHLRLDLAGPLPTPEPFQEEEPWDGAPRTAGDRLAGLAWSVGLWLVGGFLLLGCVLAVRFLAGLL